MWGGRGPQGLEDPSLGFPLEMCLVRVEKVLCRQPEGSSFLNFQKYIISEGSERAGQ